MNGRIAVGMVCVAVLAISVTAQQGTHLNQMVDLLIAKKAIFGVGVPTVGRAGGGGNRAGGAPGAPAGGAASGGATVSGGVMVSGGGLTATPTPTTPPPPPKTPAELAADAMAHPEVD